MRASARQHHFWAIHPVVGRVSSRRARREQQRRCDIGRARRNAAAAASKAPKSKTARRLSTAPRRYSVQARPRARSDAKSIGGLRETHRPRWRSRLHKDEAAPAPKLTVLLGTRKKGEVNELRTLLRSPAVERDPKRKREVIKKVIAYMTLGIDVSPLFSQMVMSVETRRSRSKKDGLPLLM